MASNFSVAVEMWAIGFLTAAAPIVVALFRHGERRRALFLVLVSTVLAIGFAAFYSRA